MPEPDFDQIARGIVDGLYSPDDMADPDVEIPKVVADVAEQLRQVWNARGAADIAQLEALEVIPDHVSDDAIRALDR